jgi:hypothetical protein
MDIYTRDDALVGKSLFRHDCADPASKTTMTQRPPNQPDYNSYSPLTGNESTSSELSNKNNMEEADTGQQPTEGEEEVEERPSASFKKSVSRRGSCGL